MEVTPPDQVWEKLAASLDEINSDRNLADRIWKTEYTPPAGVWNKIEEQLLLDEAPVYSKKPVFFPFKKLAIAALIAGLVVTTWLLWFTTGEKISTQPASAMNRDTTSLQSPNIVKGKPEILIKEKPVLGSVTVFPSLQKRSQVHQPVFASQLSQILPRSAPVPAEAIFNVPLSINQEIQITKKFDVPDEDLTWIAVNNRYTTLLNANGRMVKIPVALVHLAPYFQNKPIVEDFFEILYGEGTFWKEKLSQWQKKVASLPVSSGDLFSGLVELLKTVEATAESSEEQEQ